MELANRGTIFLDEIAELPLSTQAKLLRVLEERSFERVGGTQLVDIDVRILAATNKDLREAVASKTFREDLYFRIAAVPITIPALSERGDDVLMLADHFLERFRREFRKPNLKFAPERARRFARLFVARKRPRTSEHDRARRHPDGLRDDRSAPTCSSPRRVLPMAICPKECWRKRLIGAARCRKWERERWPTWSASKSNPR